jgi:hypothetical protein
VVSVEITQAERSRWQRRAATELASILRMHPDLPILAWTVGSAGSILLGRLVAPVTAPEARARFDTWQTALGLAESSCAPSGETVHLRAEALRNQVSVLLTATAFTTEGQF